MDIYNKILRNMLIPVNVDQFVLYFNKQTKKVFRPRRWKSQCKHTELGKH